MDWLIKTQDVMSPNVNSLYFGSGTSRVIKTVFDDESAAIDKDTESEDQLNEWLEENIHDPCDFNKGFAVVLGGRAKDRAEETLHVHNPVLLQYVPWARTTFDNIVHRMQINGSAVSTIVKGGTAVFNKTTISRRRDGLPAIIYNCRSSNTWRGDMSLSVTYIPSTHSIYAILFGCSPEAMENVRRRLAKAEGAVFHPLLLPGIFAELERQRQFSLVQAGLTQRAQFLMNLLRNNTYDWKFRSDDEEDTSTIDAVDLWMDISNLCNALKRWREQLLLMISHADELPGLQLHGDPTARMADGSSTPRSQLDADMALQRDIRIAGTLIKERLIEISMEYEEKIRDCDMMMDGMAMATQLAHAKTNMEIAVQTRRDGSQMKSIAILTMVFLPATFVATVFSTSFFTWKASEDGSLVSKWFWLYVVVSIGLTLMTLGLWFFCAHGSKKMKRVSVGKTRQDEKA